MNFNGVFEGGGVRGIGLVGALMRLEEKDIHFNAVAGTSAGSIVAALYAAGYTTTELKAVLWAMDFQALLDPAKPKVYHLWKNYGIYKGNEIYKWVFQLLQKKKVCFFADLQMPLIVIAADLTNRVILRFDQESYPRMVIAEAVRMSIGIPLFFQAYPWGKSLVVDGGLLSNYPVHVFADAPRAKTKTIGFKLVASRSQLAPDLPKGFSGYLGAILGTLLEAHDKEDQKNLAWANTIHIPTGSISATKFNLSDDEKRALFDAGYSAATKFLDEFELTIFAPTPEAIRKQEESVNRVQKIINQAFTALPELERRWLLGKGEQPLSAELRALLEDADKKVCAWDLLQIDWEPSDMAEYFVKLALYWRNSGDDERAIERLERAVALDPHSVTAHEQLGQTLSYVAAETPSGSPKKPMLLERAKKMLVRAQELQGTPRAETLHALAWTHDELGEYGEAVVLYKRARAQANSKEEIATYNYNLACALAKAGDLLESLVQLKQIIDQADFVLWAERDSDFDELRNSNLGPAFVELVDKEKKRRSL